MHQRPEGLKIDDFSAGVFNLTGGAVGITATQGCGAFCLGGHREVLIQSKAAGQVASPERDEYASFDV